jgi:hypothetical protein
VAPAAVAPAAAPAAAASLCRDPADTVVDRFEGGVVAPSINQGRVACGATLGQDAAFCVKVLDGPFVVTDLDAPAGCPNDLVVMAAGPQTVRWSLGVGGSAPAAVHGARLAIKTGEALFIGARAPTEAKLSADRRCAVIWNGFRPY